MTAVTARRFARITMQLVYALIAVVITLLLCYLLTQSHSMPAPAPTPPAARGSR